MNGVAPDLICYFGNLAWRSIGSIGDGRVQARENDTGPDDANHAKYGIAISRPGHAGHPPEDAHLFDIALIPLTASGWTFPSRRGAGCSSGCRVKLALLRTRPDTG